MSERIIAVLDQIEAQQQHSVIAKGITAPEPADMVMRDEVKLTPQQMRAMIELLPFHAPKLSAVGVGYMTQQHVRRTSRARHHGKREGKTNRGSSD